MDSPSTWVGEISAQLDMLQISTTTHRSKCLGWLHRHVDGGLYRLAWPCGAGRGHASTRGRSGDPIVAKTVFPRVFCAKVKIDGIV